MPNVNCVKLNKLAEGLDNAPWPGELGERIVANISKEAWHAWLGEQTILINENQLSPINPEHKTLLKAEMVKYLFGEDE